MSAYVRDTLLAQLKRFDEEAFVALANRGLLRRARKDLEKQAADIVKDGDSDAVTMRFAGHRIRFDVRGPAHASCSCPSSGVCQHILAAALTLHRMSVGGEGVPAATAMPAGTPGTAARSSDAALECPTPAGAASAAAATPPLTAEGEPAPDWEPGAGPVVREDALAPLHEALLEIDAARLITHAGKAGYRWAWQMVSDFESDESGVALSGERHIIIELRQPPLRFRYMGGGPESLLADGEVKSLAKYQVAAILAYRRAHGAPMTPPPPAKGKTAALDLGKDFAMPDDSATARVESRARLRESASQLIEDCVDLGLSHLSSAVYERFSTLAVWAQGAGYYRLALLLRRIADHVELLLDRAGAADEHRLLDELTLAYALIAALGGAETRGQSPARLIGRARSEYADAGALELVGLGASAWRSAAGYAGLTMILYSPTEQRFFSCSDARPEMQRGFNPRARYKSSGPWSGLGAPALLTGRRVRLSKAQTNAQGRLSATESTTAAVQAAPELYDVLPSWRSWRALGERRSPLQRSLLAEPQPMLDWVVLQPARFGVPQFDANRQALVWLLFDAEGQALPAELEYSELNEHAIVRVEQLNASALPTGTRLVGRLSHRQGRLSVEPLSLVRPVSSAGENAVDALHFDAAAEPNAFSKWLHRLAAGREADRTERTSPGTPSAALPAPLVELRDRIRSEAERGSRTIGVQRPTASTLEQARIRCEEIGFTAFARWPHTATNSPAAQLLKTNYVRMQYERLLDDAESPVD